MKDIKILIIIALVVVLAAVVGASYYQNSVQSVRKSAAAESALVRPDSATLGSVNAPVTLVEFYDPECESCRAFYPAIKKILKEYDGKIRFVARYMPLHKNSRLAAAFTEAAGEQGRYWEMQENLFARQPEWGERHGPPQQQAANETPVAVLFEKYAAELGLDVEKVRAFVAENRSAAKLEQDLKDGQSLGVKRTPTFFVNGRELARFGEQDLRSLINEELKK